MPRNARAWFLALLALVAGGARGEELDWVLCSGEVYDVYAFLETREGTMLAGGYGVHRRALGETDWLPADMPSNGTVIGLCEASDGTLYAAGGSSRVEGEWSGTVWRSFDDGATWEETGEIRDTDGRLCGGNAYRLSEGADGFVYLGTRCGVFRTNDAGSTWALTSRPWGAMDAARAVLACSGGYVLAGVEGRVYRTDDGGATWRHIYSAAHGFFATNMIEARDGYVYVGGWGVYRTNDGGTTWEIFGALESWSAHVLLDGPDGHVYAATWDGPVFRMDGFLNWTRVSPFYGHAVGADSAGYLYADGDGYIYRTVEPVPGPGILALLVGGAIILKRRAKAPI